MTIRSMNLLYLADCSGDLEKMGKYLLVNSMRLRKEGKQTFEVNENLI